MMQKMPRPARRPQRFSPLLANLDDYGTTIAAFWRALVLLDHRDSYRLQPAPARSLRHRRR